MATMITITAMMVVQLNLAIGSSVLLVRKLVELC